MQLDSHDIFCGRSKIYIKKEILKRTALNEIKVLPYGLDYKNIESTSFAWLAKMRTNKKYIKDTQVTGAKRARYIELSFVNYYIGSIFRAYIILSWSENLIIKYLFYPMSKPSRYSRHCKYRVKISVGIPISLYKIPE